MSNRVIPNYQSGVIPFNFTYSPQCRLNEMESLIPPTACVNWGPQPMPPTTLKSLYSERGFDYPYRFISKPQNTLYKYDFSQSYPTGLGRQKIIGGGHYKVWPLTNEHVFEAKDYTEDYFQRPSDVYPISTSLVTKPNYLRTGYQP